MSRWLRPVDQTLQTDQQKKTKRTHRVRKLSGICLDLVPNKSLINPHLLVQSHLIHTCAHYHPPTHTIQPCFPILCIIFIISPTLQLLKYWWKIMTKPRSHDLANPSWDKKWLKAKVGARQWGQTSVRHSFPQGPGFLSQVRILPDIWLKHFSDFWDLLVSLFAAKKQNLKLLFSLCPGKANQPTQTASQTVLPQEAQCFILPCSQPSCFKSRRKLPSQGKRSYSDLAQFQILLPYIRISKNEQALTLCDCPWLEKEMLTPVFCWFLFAWHILFLIQWSHSWAYIKENSKIHTPQCS